MANTQPAGTAGQHSTHHNNAGTRLFCGFAQGLRALPDDITNIGPLTPEQVLQSEAVADYCDQMQVAATAGLAGIGELMALAPQCGRQAELGAVVTLLADMTQYARDVGCDYRDAANEARRAG